MHCNISKIWRFGLDNRDNGVATDSSCTVISVVLSGRESTEYCEPISSSCTRCEEDRLTAITFFAFKCKNKFIQFSINFIVDEANEPFAWVKPSGFVLIENQCCSRWPIRMTIRFG